MLMMLAFLVDQTQQLCCNLFRAVWAKLGSKRQLWESMRSLFYPYASGLSTSSLLDEQPERRPMSVILVSGACRQFL